MSPNNRAEDDDAERSGGGLHPAWREFIQFCKELGHGEIESIKIQDGIPVSGEVIRKKIRWC